MELDQNGDNELPSKSQRKKEAHALQELGERLTTFSAAQLQQLPLSDKLQTALLEFNRLPSSYGARKRQLQFIGKLMRSCDREAIIAAIARMSPAKKLPGKKSAASDEWCDKIATGGDDEINEILQLHPQLDRQRLRHLYREISRAEDAQRENIRMKLRNYLAEQIKS